LTAAGYFNAAIGGANASSADLAANQYNLAALGFGSLTIPGSSQFVAGTPGTPAAAATPGSSSAPSSPLAQTGASSSGTPANSAPPSSGGGSGSPQATGSQVRAASVRLAPGGPLLGIGLAGLGLLALLAEWDRRMMRRAQHTVNFED
jgi:hypothetical protein